MRALVTGSSGFLGAAVVRALRERGDDVTGVDVRPSATTDLVADLTADGPWQRAAGEADVVLHTAALVGEKGAPDRFWQVNVVGTQRVQAATRGRLVHLSSIVVHGPDFPDQVTEDAPVRPTGNPYTDTKIASEHLVLRAGAGGADVVVVRPGDVYGPGSVPWTVRPVQMLQRRQLAVPSGRAVLSPVYVDDVVAGALAAADVRAARGEVLHLSSGVGVPPREFFGHYARLVGRPLPVLPRALLSAAAAPVGLLGDRAPMSRRTLEYVTHPGTYSIARAAEVLGWRPVVGLDEGMRRTAQWLRDEGLVPLA